jgi:hypothetical protein
MKQPRMEFFNKKVVSGVRKYIKYCESFSMSLNNLKYNLDTLQRWAKLL